MLAKLWLAMMLGAAPVPSSEDALTVVDPNGALSGSGRIEIVGVVSSHKDQLRVCSEQFWRVAPQPQRRVTIEMHWVINPGGNVTSVASTTEGLRDTVLASCLMSAINTWTFGAGLDKKPLRVDFPFTFDPPGGVAAPTTAGRTNPEVQRVIAAHTDQVKACIAPQLQTRPELKALEQVEMHWAIELNGNVTDVLTKTEALVGTPLAACLQATIASWTFPPRRDATRLLVDVPFRFDAVAPN